MIYTGYEIIPFGKGVSAYGFGLLEQRGYLTLPTLNKWRTWDVMQKRVWLVDVNNSLRARSSE